MYKKLPFSGKECNSYLYFSFDADYFDTETVSKELNIEPTSFMIKKELVPKSTSWKYQIDAGNEIDLETYIKKLIDILEPKIEIINRLKEDFDMTTRLQFVIDIDKNPQSSVPYFGLDKRTIDFLAKTGTEVDFDLFKADTIRLLNN